MHAIMLSACESVALLLIPLVKISAKPADRGACVFRQSALIQNL